MNVLEVSELSKIYQPYMKKGGIVALDSVSMAVKEGEILGLLGPNGAGKTTLFKASLGIVSATAGDIRLFGSPPANPKSRLKIGYLPENHRFPFYYTGLGLLEAAGRMRRLAASEIASRADYLLELVGMERWADTKIRKFSKGMLQRIGLAQAMMGDPYLLLLDEPTDGVDPVGKVEIRKVLEKIRDEGKTIILNSHLLSEVESVADRVAILSRGKLIKVAGVKELTTRTSQYEIEADFQSTLIEIPEEIGRKLSISSNKMIVELKDVEQVNSVIDLLRMKKISIRSVQPLKMSLEQSFMETLGDGEKE